MPRAHGVDLRVQPGRAPGALAGLPAAGRGLRRRRRRRGAAGLAIAAAGPRPRGGHPGRGRPGRRDRAPCWPRRATPPMASSCRPPGWPRCPAGDPAGRAESRLRALGRPVIGLVAPPPPGPPPRPAGTAWPGAPPLRRPSPHGPAARVRRVRRSRLLPGRRRHRPAARPAPRGQGTPIPAVVCVDEAARFAVAAARRRTRGGNDAGRAGRRGARRRPWSPPRPTRWRARAGRPRLAGHRRARQ